mmetsp:Transcript_99985/g.172514  ORF Transcript_99985/g.172514 Transcript_99985/m.172514 type:complete len:289 (+) Transcript_99985:430-1296(+)
MRRLACMKKEDSSNRLAWMLMSTSSGSSDVCWWSVWGKLKTMNLNGVLLIRESRIICVASTPKKTWAPSWRHLSMQVCLYLPRTSSSRSYAVAVIPAPLPSRLQTACEKEKFPSPTIRVPGEYGHCTPSSTVVEGTGSGGGGARAAVGGGRRAAGLPAASINTTFCPHTSTVPARNSRCAACTDARLTMAFWVSGPSASKMMPKACPPVTGDPSFSQTAAMSSAVAPAGTLVILTFLKCNDGLVGGRSGPTQFSTGAGCAAGAGAGAAGSGAALSCSKAFISLTAIST